MPEVSYDPYGLSPKSGTIKHQIHNVWQGDTVKLYFDVALPDGSEATPENCYLTFMLKDRRFMHTRRYDGHIPTPGSSSSSCCCCYGQHDNCNARSAQWVGTLEDGIEFTRPGAVEVHIPERETAILRRGGYLFALTVQTKMLDQRKLLAEGTLQVEYSADAPNPGVYYNNNLENQNAP